MRLRPYVTSALHLSLIASFCAGCIKNPALGLTPNDVDPIVEESGGNRHHGLYRGDDQLDEQDFYNIVGDTASATAIQTSRSSGETKQTVGGVLIGVGASVVLTSLALLVLPEGGGDGDNGLDVDVEAAWVKDKSGHRYALIVTKSSQGKPIVVLMAKGAEFSVVSAGGPGGSGGSGGNGGTGNSADSGKIPEYCAGNGGSGGKGGRGGRGGSGGRIIVRMTDNALGDQIAAAAPGGRGGSSGSGGSYGSHGSEYSECKGAKDGTRGPSGADGNSGRDGSVKKQTASASELSLIMAALRDAPNLSLDAGGK